jgi:hypothetical protein
MTVYIDAEGYCLAYGYAMTMQNDEARAHLFARRYENRPTFEQVKEHWEAFQARGRELGLVK